MVIAYPPFELTKDTDNIHAPLGWHEEQQEATGVMHPCDASLRIALCPKVSNAANEAARHTIWRRTLPQRYLLADPVGATAVT